MAATQCSSSAKFCINLKEEEEFPRGGRKLMLFMVIERFKNRDANAVYRRFREHGRMAPEGLKYVDSWVETNFDRCFQLMECDDPKLFPEWIAHWEDLVECEVVEVSTSKQAQAIIGNNSDGK